MEGFLNQMEHIKKVTNKFNKIDNVCIIVTVYMLIYESYLTKD